MARVVYKICPRVAWEEAEHAGAYLGSADDLRDGFIHLSTREQVPGTLAKFFARQPDLVLVAVDATAVADRLKWEPSSSGAVYPHVYGPLPVAAALGRAVLALDPDGTHDLASALARLEAADRS
jgi:uncharacterized protein (DUF952 family)